MAVLRAAIFFASARRCDFAEQGASLYVLRMRNRPIVQLRSEQIAFVEGLLLHRSDGVMAFNKPSGLAVQTRGNRGKSLDHLLWAYARSNGKRPHLVHRIDAGTSGLVLAAETKPMAAHLSAQFSDRKVKKRYRALVSGQVPDQMSGRCEAPLLKHGRKSLLAQLDQGADAARTDWRILEHVGTAAMVEARPITGRMHQIRAHLASMQMPIMGDVLYGTGALSAPRLMLHAEALSLSLPDGGTLALTAPLPADFSAFWQRLQSDVGA